MSRVVLVLTTVPEGSLGEEIASVLVGERLAACVSVCASMTSLYRWKDAVQRDIECQLVIKTTDDRVAAVQERVTQLHSYELPEFLVLETTGGSDAYLNWVAESARSET
jgi:periplasmic divalent cation tolerance protein